MVYRAKLNYQMTGGETMEYRKTEAKDADKVLEIIEKGKESIRQMGFDQWQNGSPNMDSILSDIEKGYGYVFLSESGEISGTAAVCFDGEPVYEKIYEGAWISDINFAVVHRFAVNLEYRKKGIATEMLKTIEKMCLEKDCHSMRIDTHRGNIPMQKTILKSGFSYCGVVYMPDGSERLAYEKLI